MVNVIVSGYQTEAGNYTATIDSISNTNYKLPTNHSVQFVINKPVAYTSEAVDETVASTTGINISQKLDNMDYEDDGAVLTIPVATKDGGEVTVAFDKNAIAMLAENDNVKLTFETKTGDEATAQVKDAEMILEISLDGATFENGTATITADFENNAPQGKVAKVYYIDANGKKTDMHATFANGKVTFKTNHFSTYAIVYESPASVALIIILCILLVAIIAFVIVWFVVLKKSFKDIFKRKPKEEKPAEEATYTEEVEKEGVTFGDKKTMNEEYMLLTKEDRKLYDRIKAHALTLENVKTSEAQDYYTVSYNKEKVVRFKLKRGEIIAEFFSNDKEFKELAGAKAKETASTKIKVKTEEDANKVIEIIDYKFKALSENKD